MKENNKLWIVISILTLLVGVSAGYIVNTLKLTENNKTEEKNNEENDKIIEAYDTDNLLKYVAIVAAQNSYSGKLTEEIAANSMRYYYIHDIDTNKYGASSSENINDKYTLIKKQDFEKTINSSFNHKFSETYKKILNFKEENENYRFEWVSATGSEITIPFVDAKFISKITENDKRIVSYEIKCEYISYTEKTAGFKETTIGKVVIDSKYNKDTKSFIINNITYTSLVDENSGACYQ